MQLNPNPSIHKDIRKNLGIISTLYDITKASVNVATYNNTIVLCIFPYMHMYYFVLDKIRLTRSHKIKGSISLDYLGYLAKYISQQVEG